MFEEIKYVKINNSERLLNLAPKQDKLWIAYLDKDDIDWINNLSDFKQEVKEKIRLIISDEWEKRKLKEVLGIEEE